MKKTLFLFAVVGLSGCSTIQERLAKRVNCDHTKLALKDTIKVPAYTQYKFNCEGKDYVCKDAPFYSSCNEDKPGAAPIKKN